MSFSSIGRSWYLNFFYVNNESVLVDFIGTVYDDLTEKGCVAVNKCSCKLHGQLYSPGQKIANECEEW